MAPGARLHSTVADSMTSAPATTNTLEPMDGDSYYDQFYVYNAGDVRRHLQRLVEGRSTLVAHAEGAYEGVVTLMLQVEDASLWVDVPRGEDTLARWLGSAQLRFEGSIERVALRFACGPAVLDQHGGRPALMLPVPDRVLHLQRLLVVVLGCGPRAAEERPVRTRHDHQRRLPGPRDRDRRLGAS